MEEKTPKSDARGKKKIKCFTCNEEGHISTDCPWKRVNLAEEEEDQEPHFDTKSNTGEDDIIYGDTVGEAFIIKQTLIADQEEEDWLRTNIFRTKGRINDKICDMIIDGGSCTNVVEACSGEIETTDGKAT